MIKQYANHIGFTTYTSNNGFVGQVHWFYFRSLDSGYERHNKLVIKHIQDFNTPKEVKQPSFKEALQGCMEALEYNIEKSFQSVK